MEEGCQICTHSRGIGLISLKIQGLLGRSKVGCQPFSNNSTPCIQVTSGLLAMFPAPLLFGHILDKSCVYEGDGDCELYNLQTMGRDFYIGMMILIVAVIGFECLIYRNSKDFDLYGTKKIMKWKYLSESRFLFFLILSVIFFTYFHLEFSSLQYGYLKIPQAYLNLIHSCWCWL